MLRSLKTQLAVSHSLPVLLLLPLISMVILYLLETRYFLGNFANEMIDQATLVAEVVNGAPEIWTDPEAAQTVVQRLQDRLSARLVILDADGRQLAPELYSDEAGAAAPLSYPVVQRAFAGETAWDVENALRLGTRVVDVAVPLDNMEGSPESGVVWLSYSIADLEDRLLTLRWYVLGTTVIGLTLAVGLALLLARSLSRPLLRLSAAVANFRLGVPPEPLPAPASQELRTLVDRYNEMAASLYEAETTRQHLLAGVVHELSRPLGAISSAAQLLSRSTTLPPDFVHEAGADIEGHVQDMKQQIDDLALLAQRDRGEIRLRPQPVHLSTLISSKCGYVLDKIAEKGNQVILDVKQDLPPVWADPARTAQILCNLIDNAGKYTPADGQIIIRAEVQQDAAGAVVAVCVTDSGPGIPVEEQEKIFQFFYRAPAQRQVRDGMGIGLALGRELAAAHGGSLTVTSAPGKGATFILRLPVATSQDTPIG